MGSQDWKEFKDSIKQRRDEKEDKFIHVHLPKIQELTPVQERENGSFSFQVDGFGTVDYYPKGGKLLIRSQNDWIKRGLDWIYQNLINKK